MLRKRRVFSVEPLWKSDRAWRPAESCVVLTSVSMFRKLQDPQPEISLCLGQDGKIKSRGDRWGEAGSLRDPVPCQLSFLPPSGRLLKSESEDSGVEMASNDHSPSTPVGSEKSFSVDCLEGFQPAVEDSPPTTPPESCLSEEESEDPGGPVQDPVYHRNLSVSKKLAQVVQRSQKHRLLGHSPGQLAPKAQSVVDSGGLTSYRLHQLLAFDESMDAGTDADGDGDGGGHFEPPPGSNTPEEPSKEKEVCGGTSLSMPGQGLRYLEHICQMLEKIAQLQQANLRLQRQHQVLECRIRSQEAENEDHSEENSGDPESVRVEPQTEDPATPETVEEEDDAHPADSWHPHHFRARSASDTRILRNTARNLRNKADPSRRCAAHSASSPSLLDQLDGVSHTLPPGIKLKNGHSHWGRVKGLINRITRKSVRSRDPAPPTELPLGYRQCRSDPVLDKHESHPRWRFLPTLGVKKRGSKHLSMR